ncbi:MAG: pilus assembly FimT family protein [Longimicrobiales bacterium]
MDRRSGFSLVELLFVVLVASIMIGIIVPSFGQLQARRSAQNARDAFVFLANRARAEALQRGRMVRLRLDAADESAALVVGVADTIAEPLDFQAAYGVSVAMNGGGDLEICYLPRGFADPSCPATEQVATFTAGSESVAATIRVLGQVETN